MKSKKIEKVTRYAVSSAMVVNALAAPVAVFAAEEKLDPSFVQNAVKELMEAGIMGGDSKGDLNLEGNLTRIQVAAILARALNLDVSNPTSTFSDVSSDNWGLKYIDALGKLGIMIGDNGKFRPNDVLTKEELAVVLVRVTQTNIVGKGNNIPVNDADQISDWAKGYVQAAIEAGLLPVQDNKFAPKKQITREEVAVVANNFIKSEDFTQYKENVKTLLDEGKKISNSDPTV